MSGYTATLDQADLHVRLQDRKRLAADIRRLDAVQDGVMAHRNGEWESIPAEEATLAELVSVFGYGIDDWVFDREKDELLLVPDDEFSDNPNLDCHDLMLALAPYCRDGDYLEFHDEAARIWRIVFQQGKAYEVRPEITWPDVDVTDSRQLQPIALPEWAR